jgi:hypothetical protein
VFWRADLSRFNMIGRQSLRTKWVAIDKSIEMDNMFGNVQQIKI